MLLYRLIDVFEKSRLKFAIVGGYAMALHGAVRGTIDVDLIISFREEDFLVIERALLSLGFQSKIPVAASQIFAFRQEYIRERNLIAWSFYNPARHSEIVDILLTEDLSKIKPVKIKVGTRTIPVASISDLIRMKKKSGRPQDLADIEALQSIQKGDR